MKKANTSVLFIPIICWIIFGCSTKKSIINEPQLIQEYRIQELNILGPLSLHSAEISGLCWYNNYLIFLPQYPAFPDKGGGGCLYYISKENLKKSISSNSLLQPTCIPFIAPDLRNSFDCENCFEGYEAISFIDNTAYLTIEVKAEPGTAMSYLLKGTMPKDLSMMAIHASQMIEIESQSNMENMAEESIITFGDKLITIHEANGRSVNPNALAHTLSSRLQLEDSLSFPQIPYRITDATAIDRLNRFWAINYLYSGDTILMNDTDFIGEQYGKGATHKRDVTVERLLEFRIGHEGIELTDEPPIQLELLEGIGRNWEGIVRLDDAGFLLVTDKFPKTIIAYVSKQLD